MSLDAKAWTQGVWRAGVVDVPLSSMTSLEVGQKGGSNAGKGALIGGVIGAVPGLLLGVAMAEDEFFEVSPGDVVRATLFTGAIGAGIGAIIGAMSHGTTWVAVPLDDYRVNLMALEDGLGVSVSIRF